MRKILSIPLIGQRGDKPEDFTFVATSFNEELSPISEDRIVAFAGARWDSQSPSPGWDSHAHAQPCTASPTASLHNFALSSRRVPCVVSRVTIGNFD